MLSNGNHANHALELEAPQNIVLSNDKDLWTMPPFLNHLTAGGLDLMKLRRSKGLLCQSGCCLVASVSRNR